MTSPLIDCHNHLGVDQFFYLNGYSPYAQDLPALVTEGRHCGISRWVVFPMVANLTFDLAAMRTAQLVPGGCETVPYAFENERMLREIYELYPDLGRQTLPFVILDPQREPAAQIAKLRALHREFPFYGLKIQATMIEADIRALLTTGRGFLELAAELDVPFLIHSSVAPEDKWSQASDILDVSEATSVSASRTPAASTGFASSAWPPCRTRGTTAPPTASTAKASCAAWATSPRSRGVSRPTTRIRPRCSAPWPRRIRRN